MRWALPGGWTMRRGTPSTSAGAVGLERPHHEGHQVRRHLHGGGEADPAAPGAGPRRLLHDGAVRVRGQTVVDDQGHVEGGLAVGLVPAGEGAAGVGGLHLGGGDDVLGPVVGGERAAVEAVSAARRRPSHRRPEERDVEVRTCAVLALREIGDARAVEPLVATFKDGDQGMRTTVAEALGMIGDRRAVEPLIAALEDKKIRRPVAEV